MTDKQIIIDGVNVIGCLFYQTNFEEDYDVKIKHYCSNWHNSCESNNNSNCYYKQLQREKQKLERITNMLFTGQCSNCEGYSPNCSNKELCDFKHNIKNIIDEVE